MRLTPQVITAMLSAGIEPPKEFRIFKAGWNHTLKGDFLFDEEAAAMVMAAYHEHGVDRPIDLEHFSIPDDNDTVKDPDARGWFKLEVRNGELWAVDVSWTPDGDKRLRNRTQRYISPFFGFDKKTRRVVSLYNVAICAIPATKDMPALVAASARCNRELAALSIEADDMNEFKKVLAALGLGDDASLEDALNAIKAYQEAGEKKDAKAKDDADEGDDKDKGEEKNSDDTKDDKDDVEGLTPKLRGMFLALTSNVEKLTKEVKTLKGKQTKSEVEQLISENIDKVPLHMEPFLKSQPLEVVTEFLKHAIPTPRAKTPPKDPTKGTEVVTLTADEKKLAELSGITEEKQLEYKKLRLAADRKRSGQQAD